MNELQRYSGGGSGRRLRGGAPHAPRGAEGDRRHYGTALAAADAGGAGASRAGRQGFCELGAPGHARRSLDRRRDRRISREGGAARRVPRAAAQTGRFPVVLVCHENRGLTRHIEDRHAARRKGRLRRARGGPALARRWDRQARLRRESRDSRQGGSRAPRAGFQERLAYASSLLPRAGIASE